MDARTTDINPMENVQQRFPNGSLKKKGGGEVEKLAFSRHNASSSHKVNSIVSSPFVVVPCAMNQ